MTKAFLGIYELRELEGPIIVNDNYLVYVRPKSFLITPIWYRFDRLSLEWSWTPYKTLDEWISIHQLTVPHGYWEGQEPAKPNVKIIRYLQQVDNYELFKNTPYSLSRYASNANLTTESPVYNLAPTYSRHKISQIFAKNNNMVDIRNIILIGRTGSGKSTIANVLINEEQNFDDNGNFVEEFKEGEFGVAQTKHTQVREFEISGRRYRIIDTIGIGDTQLPEGEVLYRIAEACCLLSEDGINQVLFVSRGRFDDAEVKAYNILRSIIFDSGIDFYTTIIKTGFENFENDEKCKMDCKLLCQNGQAGAEIVRACRKVIHVDNPPVNISGGRNIEERNKEHREIRKESRNRILAHLATCHDSYPYHPVSLREINNEVGYHVSRRTERDREAVINKMEKRIRDLERRLTNQSIFELMSIKARKKWEALVEIKNNCKQQ